MPLIKKPKKLMRKNLLLTLTLLLSATVGLMAQGVTTASISGKVTGIKSSVTAEQRTTSPGEVLPGANVVATHTPSGSTYGATTQADGRFVIPGMRIGGPYVVKVSFVGYKETSYTDIYLSLGAVANLDIQLPEESTDLEAVVVSADKSDIFSADRTGAGTNITKQTINSLPTISRSINDFTRLTPQANGRSFAGTDARLNNITIDGSIFNNSFGLADQPGGRTGSTPISLDAIEEVQVNIAPFDVRQAGFTGAGVNAVTRSGTNEFSGSVFYNIRNESFVGTKAKDLPVVVNSFDVKQYAFRIGGPIIKDKLFFFANAELERRTEPATNFRANTGTEPVTGNVTRVLASDLDALSSFLKSTYGYETGPYQGYNNESFSDKFLIKFDYNINQNNKLSLRYNYLDSETDVLLSNSASLGFGARRSNINALNYKNSNYKQTEKIQSVIAELNSRISGKLSNQIIAGYTFQNEDRGSAGNLFPLVEIQNGGTTYITFGSEPFTPSNKLNYKTYQFQDNLTYYGGKHTVTAGFNFERFEFENVFFPGSQSVYVYNSLANFYAATDANPTNDPTLRRFQLRYSGLPGGAEPVQPTKVNYMGLYLQDEFQPIERLKITAGIRFDVPSFENTGRTNTSVEPLSFNDANGNAGYKINTSKLPDANVLISPRFGFNYDVFGNRSTQVRGGTGLFTGRPAFVWISNQIGNNGVLTGFEQLDNTLIRPFSPNPAAYIPATPTLPSSVELAATDPSFKFPQIWRSNLAVDQKLPFGLVGTLEYIYSKDVNGVTYWNANLPGAQSSFVGPDTRARWTNNRVNPGPGFTVTSAEVLSNNDQGYSTSLTAMLSRPFKNGFTAMAAYNYGESKNVLDAGSIARGSWTGNAIVNNPNKPDLAFSSNDQTHRVIASASYRKEYLGFAATQISMVWESRTQGRFSYVYSGDANGDAATGNDLIWVPRDAATDLIFDNTWDPDGSGPLTAGSYSAAQQAADFNAYISQDEYLSSRRGQYAERNGALRPWLTSVDLSIVQEFFVKVGDKGKRNTIQIRADFTNIGNLLNSAWGVSDLNVQTQLLNRSGFTAAGEPIYRFTPLSTAGGTITPVSRTYQTRTTINDVWQAQLSLRYIFN